VPQEECSIDQVAAKHQARYIDDVFCLNCGIAAAITKTMRTRASRVPASRMAKTLDNVEVRTLGLTDSGTV